MKKYTVVTVLCFLIVGLVAAPHIFNAPVEDGAPPYVLEDLIPPDPDPYAWLSTWTRPDGPTRVGLQVGHWKNDELPEELARLKGNTGASGGGKWEWEVNFAIAQETKKLLIERGIEVDILPSTIPADYWADVFVAIHADGSTDRGASGYKVASPRRDYSGNAVELVEEITKSYGAETKLVQDPNISRNMTGYYAFAWWRYEHAVHPKTASAILETGFLTNANDRRTIVGKPEVSAKGLANGIIEFLKKKQLLS